MATEIQQDQRGDDREAYHHYAHTPIYGKKQQQHSQEREHIAQQTDDKIRKKARERIHIAIHALDHLSRSASLMKAQIQREAMCHQIRAHLVGRGPGDIGAQICLHNSYSLPGERNGDKEQTGVDQRKGGPSGNGGIDKEAQDLRIQQLQANAAQYRECQEQHPDPLRFQVRFKKDQIAYDRHMPFKRNIHVYPFS